jgi:RimJ/RimL family protein N-acetyltransferase
MVKALYSDSITLHLIDEENLSEVGERFRGFADSDRILKVLEQSYVPRYREGVRTKYGFYSMLEGELAGLTLLGISSWRDRRGYTGADILEHMRGKGVAPRSKPHLFYLAFAVLGLNRVETGCLASNLASQRSIEKTAGFHFEGVLREFARNEGGEFEDEYRYAILRRDWLALYDRSQVEVIA